MVVNSFAFICVYDCSNWKCNNTISHYRYFHLKSIIPYFFPLRMWTLIVWIQWISFDYSTTDNRTFCFLHSIENFKIVGNTVQNHLFFTSMAYHNRIKMTKQNQISDKSFCTKKLYIDSTVPWFKATTFFCHSLHWYKHFRYDTGIMVGINWNLFSTVSSNFVAPTSSSLFKQKTKF